jgi:hypothetical protein
VFKIGDVFAAPLTVVMDGGAVEGLAKDYTFATGLGWKKGEVCVSTVFVLRIARIVFSYRPKFATGSQRRLAQISKSRDPCQAERYILNIQVNATLDTGKVNLAAALRPEKARRSGTR